MKTFKQYFTNEDAQGVPAADMKPKKKPEEDAEFVPVSAGEKKFKKLHTDKSKTQDYPVKVDNQFSADKDAKHDDHEGDGAKDEKGEKTSAVTKPKDADQPEDDKDGSKKRDKSKAAGKDDGEKKVPKQGSSDADNKTKVREEILDEEHKAQCDKHHVAAKKHAANIVKHLNSMEGHYDSKMHSRELEDLSDRMENTKEQQKQTMAQDKKRKAADKASAAIYKEEIQFSLIDTVANVMRGQ